MKQAIVFGGAGFVGAHLLRHLRQSGAYGRLVSVDIQDPREPAEGVEYRRGDIRAPLASELDGAYDEIYNLAAVHRTPGHAPHEYYVTNVAGALEVCAFARRNNVKRMLFTSSIAVYGPDEDLKSEASVPEPTSDYGRSKLLAEGVHRQWLASDGEARLVTVRPAVIFGKGEQGNFTRLAGALRKGMFVYPGRKDTIKCCGYVGELVRSMEFATGLGERELLYNFCFPHAYTIEEICDAFGRVVGYAPPRGLVPLGLMNVAALPFETVHRVGFRNGISRERILKLVRSTRVAPRTLLEKGFVFQSDLDDALRRWMDESRDRILV